MGGAGPLGSAYAPGCDDFVEALARMRYGFVVRLQAPQSSRALTTVSSPAL
jgi:hypothetical protein